MNRWVCVGYLKGVHPFLWQIIVCALLQMRAKVSSPVAVTRNGLRQSKALRSMAADMQG